MAPVLFMFNVKFSQSAHGCATPQILSSRKIWENSPYVIRKGNLWELMFDLSEWAWKGGAR